MQLEFLTTLTEEDKLTEGQKGCWQQAFQRQQEKGGSRLQPAAIQNLQKCSTTAIPLDKWTAGINLMLILGHLLH